MLGNVAFASGEIDGGAVTAIRGGRAYACQAVVPAQVPAQAYALPAANTSSTLVSPRGVFVRSPIPQCLAQPLGARFRVTLIGVDGAMVR